MKRSPCASTLSPTSRATCSVVGWAATSRGGPTCASRPSSSTQTLVGQGERVDRVVGDQQRDAVVRREVAGQLDPQRRGDADVEPGERLVEQQQRGARWPGRGRSTTRCAWPPDSSRGRRPARSPTPNRSSHSWAVRCGRLAGDARGCAARRRRSRGRSGAGRAAGPGRRARPTARARDAAAASRTGRRRRRRPRRRRVPATARSSVDLPAPLGPITATTVARRRPTRHDVRAGRAPVERRAHERSWAGQPPVAEQGEHADRHHEQHHAQRCARRAGRTGARCRSATASSGWCRGSCRRR